MKSFFKTTINFLFYAFLTLLFLFILLFTLLQFGLLVPFSSTKFDKNKLTYSAPNVTILDNQNKKINYKAYKQHNLAFKDIPKHTLDAFISIEDKKFYNHKGINYKRIATATLKNISKMSLKEGASTISQQLIKNTHLTSEKTLKRKFNEIVLTKELENNLSKQEILTSYLNAIYFGNGAFGLEQASQKFFSLPASQLSVPQSATLAGIIRSPKRYSPITNPEECLKRRNLVLSEMKKDKKISINEYELYIKTPLGLNINKNFSNINSYYNSVIEEACELLKLTEKDFMIKQYTIYTYLDTSLQKILENEINNKLDKKISNACGLVIDNKTGGIKAFSGISNYNILHLYRQPGSVLKPVISYAPALEKNIISPLTPLLDNKINIDGYTPQNYKHKFHGWVSAKTALANSYNIPSIKLLDYVKIDYAKKFAQKLGLNLLDEDAGYSIALGGLTQGIKIKDLANCYQAFANNGKLIKLRFIKYIKNNNGKIIYKNPEFEKRVMKDSTAYLITDMLRESVTNGTCKKLNLQNLYIAGKTGTVGIQNKKHKNSDAWNISYTPSSTVCVWVGATSKLEPLDSNILGGTLPTTIAKNIYANGDFKNELFTKPKSIKEISINEIDYIKNNKITIATPNTPERYIIKGYFDENNLPTETSSLFTTLPDIKLNAIRETDSVKLSFDTNKHIKYNLFREQDDEVKLLKTICNQENNFDFIDRDIKKNNLYKYYITSQFLNNSINRDQTSLQNKSNEVFIYFA